MSKAANAITWPGNSLVPPSGHAVLEGVTLRIGVIESPPFPNRFEDNGCIWKEHNTI